MSEIRGRMSEGGRKREQKTGNRKQRSEGGGRKRRADGGNRERRAEGKEGKGKEGKMKDRRGILTYDSSCGMKGIGVKS